MQIVAERTMVPRPIQRPSDVERRPIDFGIEPTPPAPPKPEATIVKSAISKDPVLVIEQTPAPDIDPPATDDSPTNVDATATEDEWGDGIL
jgi:hypothetical protein